MIAPAAFSLSIALFMASLPFETMCLYGRCSGWPGWGVLVFGPLGLGMSIANLAWLANPLVVLAWISGFMKMGGIATVLAAAALAAGVAFRFADSVVVNTAGSASPLTGVAAGYWLWLASLAVCFGGAAWLAWGW